MRQNHRRFRLDVWGWTTIAILLLYGLFLLYPLGLLLKMAFSDGMHFTLSHFVRFFSRPYYSITLINSFKVSFMAALLSVLVGVTLGYFIGDHVRALCGRLRLDHAAGPQRRHY